MALVPLDDVWVDANFKEVQLRNMRVGQPVSLRADLYGSQVEFHGRIAGLSAGSGSAFALLPAQNASGNWIKIVQRLPVRIVIDPQELKAHPLRVGLSMTAEVDVHDTSGPVVSTQVRNVPQPAQASAGDDPELEAAHQRIVAQNAGRDAAALARACVLESRRGEFAGRDLPPLSGVTHALVALALALGTFMQVLDTSIANVAIPTIAGNLGVSSDQGTWVITSFAVSNGISCAAHRLADAALWRGAHLRACRCWPSRPHRSSAALPGACRRWSCSGCMQGAVSGPMIPGSQALLLRALPAGAERAPRWRSGRSPRWWRRSPVRCSAAISPTTGAGRGSSTSMCRSGCYAGLVCLAVSGKRETPTRKLPIDTVGLGLLIVWVGALQVMLDQGKDLDWFSSPAIVALTRRGRDRLRRLADLGADRALSDRRSCRCSRGATSRSGHVALCLGYAVFFGNIVLLPLWLQTQLGYTATWAGLVAAPAGVVSVLVTPLRRPAGRQGRCALDRHGRLPRASPISFFMRAGLTADASFVAFVLPQLVLGIGMGDLLRRDDLHPARRRAAGARAVGLRRVQFPAHRSRGAFATSITTTFWDRHEALHQTHLAESSAASTVPHLQRPSIVSCRLSASAMIDTRSSACCPQDLMHQAYLLSSLDYFWISGWLTSGAAVLRCGWRVSPQAE